MRNEIALKKVGLKIRDRRRALGFTQESFAHHARIARTYYGRVEQGRQNLSLETLFHVAAYLEMAPCEFLDEVTLEDCKVSLSTRTRKPLAARS